MHLPCSATTISNDNRKQVMFDTVGATGQQTGIVFYVVWLVMSRWLVVAMVVTVLFYRIGVDTEDYLKVAAKNSMRSVFALERAFMQCHKSHVFLTWRRRYEEVGFAITEACMVIEWEGLGKHIRRLGLVMK